MEYKFAIGVQTVFTIRQHVIITSSDSIRFASCVIAMSQEDEERHYSKNATLYTDISTPTTSRLKKDKDIAPRESKESYL